MNRLATIAVFAVLFAAGTAAQAALAGRWEGATPNGTPIVLDLAVKGTAVTGTLTRQGQDAPLSDAVATKTGLTFKAKVGDQVEAFSGELAGDELKIWLDRQGVGSAVVLKRVKRT